MGRKIETELKFYGGSDFSTNIVLINGVPFALNELILEENEIVIEESNE